MATLCNSCEQQESCKTAQNNNIKITNCGRYFQTRRETVKVKQTNADRIRAMSDEELAEFIAARHYTPHCPIPWCEENADDCTACWLKWLRKEADEEEM